MTGIQSTRDSLDPEFGSKPMTIEFTAKMLRSLQSFGQGLIFESGGLTAGISLTLNHRSELVLSLCMGADQQSRSM